MYGITTVVGLLGTDGIAREMTSLLAKVKGLKEKGITAYAYTGSYQIPVCTVTGNITKDIMLIEEIIGTGEVALSDHRSGQPSFDEFAKLGGPDQAGRHIVRESRHSRDPYGRRPPVSGSGRKSG